MKAVFHINEACKWATTFNSSMNACKTARANAQPLEAYIVANGEAVNILIPGSPELLEQRVRLFDAIALGIQVYFCEKAMSLRGLALPKDLEEAGAEMVASSAYAIIQLQEQGFAYIKS